MKVSCPLCLISEVKPWSNIKWRFEAERKKKKKPKQSKARKYLVPSAESEASYMETHSNSPTSQYSFFSKPVVLHSNWGMVTRTVTLYVQVSHSVKILSLVQNQNLSNSYKSCNDASLLDQTSSSGSYRFSFHLRKDFFYLQPLRKVWQNGLPSSDLSALFWGYHAFLRDLDALSS